MALSSFVLEDDVVYHTYTCYDRGTDVLERRPGSCWIGRRRAGAMTSRTSAQA